MKRRTGIGLALGLLVAAAAWLSWRLLFLPVWPAYDIIEQPLVQTVVATGRVTAVSRAQVGSAVTGVVLERRVREGDTVRRGDVLAVLRADDLEAAVREAEAALAELQESTRPQAAAAVREAEVALEQAGREARRRRELVRERAIPREEMERAVQAEASARAALERAQLAAQALGSGHPNEAVARARLASARAQLDKTVIRAEVAGTVLTRNVEPGDLVQPSRVLFEIARHDEVEVLVPLDEKNLEVLAVGQPAQCVADAYPRSPFAATVSFIAPSIDPQRGTVDVRLAVAPAPGFLKQDMTVSVNVETGRRERAVVVPNDALGTLPGHRAAVWVVDDGRAVRREVTLGLRGLVHSEVTAGLRAGDRVLADGEAAVAEGARLRVTLRDGPGDAGDTATSRELPMRLD